MGIDWKSEPLTAAYFDYRGQHDRAQTLNDFTMWLDVQAPPFEVEGHVLWYRSARALADQAGHVVGSILPCAAVDWLYRHHEVRRCYRLGQAAFFVQLTTATQLAVDPVEPTANQLIEQALIQNWQDDDAAGVQRLLETHDPGFAVGGFRVRFSEDSGQSPGTRFRAFAKQHSSYMNPKPWPADVTL